MRAKLQNARHYFIQATDELCAIKSELPPGAQSDLLHNECDELIRCTCALRKVIEAMIVRDVKKVDDAEPILPAQSARRSQKSHAN